VKYKISRFQNLENLEMHTGGQTTDAMWR